MKLLELTIEGNPITKKNSQQIKYRWSKNRKRVPYICPSEQFIDYQNRCGWQIKGKYKLDINVPVNVKCVYYMKARYKVDLLNLLESTCDIFVKYGILHDDDTKIVKSHDGSWVYYDKDRPRVEITIETVEERTEGERI